MTSHSVLTLGHSDGCVEMLTLRRSRPPVIRRLGANKEV